MSPSHRADDPDAAEPAATSDAAIGDAATTDATQANTDAPSHRPAAGDTGSTSRSSTNGDAEPDGPASSDGPAGAVSTSSSTGAPRSAGQGGSTGNADRDQVRARYVPSGKAVGRIRIQPRGESTPVPPKKGRWWELPVLAIVAIAVAVIVKTFIVQPFYIPSESMEKTLHGCTSCNGDKILVNKPIYDVRSPHPGDIIVFSLPKQWPVNVGESPAAPRTNVITGPIRWFGQLVGVVPPDREDLVKRVIATGGQTIKCCDAQGRVEVSPTGPGGPFHALNEPYVFLDPGSSETTFGPVTVPHGRLWVMGDHRSNSADSRYHCVADDDSSNGSAQAGACDPVSSTVPISNVIGKAFVIAWPISRWRTLGTPGTFKAQAAGAAEAIAPTLPLAVGFLTVLPLWFWRRASRRGPAHGPPATTR